MHSPNRTSRTRPIAVQPKKVSFEYVGKEASAPSLKLFYGQISPGCSAVFVYTSGCARRFHPLMNSRIFVVSSRTLLKVPQ